MITWSFHNIRHEFMPSGSDGEIVALERQLHDAPLNILLTIFFFMLNLDIHLKDYILQVDSHNSRKIVRFISDLRRFAVVRFCSDERHSVEQFIEKVHEYYILA